MGWNRERGDKSGWLKKKMKKEKEREKRKKERKRVYTNLEK